MPFCGELAGPCLPPAPLGSSAQDVQTVYCRGNAAALYRRGSPRRPFCRDAGAITWLSGPVSQKTHSFGRFPQFRGVPEKSGRRTSPLSDLNDRPYGLL